MMTKNNKQGIILFAVDALLNLLRQMLGENINARIRVVTAARASGTPLEGCLGARAAVLDQASNMI